MHLISLNGSVHSAIFRHGIGKRQYCKVFVVNEMSERRYNLNYKLTNNFNNFYVYFSVPKTHCNSTFLNTTPEYRTG
jgi:hypothetical protein